MCIYFLCLPCGRQVDTWQHDTKIERPRRNLLTKQKYTYKDFIICLSAFYFLVVIDLGT